MPSERVVRVVPDVPALAKGFDYLVPAKLDDLVRVGTQVRVTLHGRRVAGWVVEDHAAPGAGLELRPLDSVRGCGPPASVVELSNWASWRWAGPRATFLKAASSATVVRSLSPKQVVPPPPGPKPWGDMPRGALGDGSPEWSEVFGSGTVVVRHPPAADLLG
ncbi:MAG: hypothetical protein ACRDV4_08770, partial [Acidimicrobiales bacterium]